MVAVRKATAADVSALAPMLHRAFADDPVIRWMLPDDDRHRRKGEFGWRSWIEVLYLPKGEVYTTDGCLGAALWSPPGQWKVPPALQVRMAPRMLRLFGVRRLPLLLRGLSLIERKHPRVPPHYTLGVLGTDPDHQGSGIGSALIQPILARCDREVLGAYLESSKPQKRPVLRAVRLQRD